MKKVPWSIFSGFWKRTYQEVSRVKPSQCIKLMAQHLQGFGLSARLAFFPRRKSSTSTQLTVAHQHPRRAVTLHTKISQCPTRPGYLPSSLILQQSYNNLDLSAHQHLQSTHHHCVQLPRSSSYVIAPRRHNRATIIAASSPGCLTSPVPLRPRRNPFLYPYRDATRIQDVRITRPILR